MTRSATRCWAAPTSGRCSSRSSRTASSTAAPTWSTRASTTGPTRPAAATCPTSTSSTTTAPGRPRTRSSSPSTTPTARSAASSTSARRSAACAPPTPSLTRSSSSPATPTAAPPSGGCPPPAPAFAPPAPAPRPAARAVERAQMAAAAVAHRHGLERLLAISTELSRAQAVDGVLDAVVDGVADALRFATVAVHLADPQDGGRLAPAARSDRDGPHAPQALPATMAQLAPLFTEDAEREGCFLLTRDEVRRRVPALRTVEPGRLNGRGPHAWRHHWLLVPLSGPDGAPIGVILADDPLDRLLPATEKLQALRLFAHQAANALATIGQREQLRILAERDPLTLLLNRRALMADLEAALAAARAEARPVALAYCDLDGFKRLNDRRGHGAGDELLRAFAEILTDSIRPEDRAYRVGGDEFALLLTGCDDAEARRVVDRVLAELARRQDADTHPDRVRASFGVAVAREPAELDAARLLHHADSAMYAEKRAAAGAAG